MRKNYNFSDGKKGLFYRPNDKFHYPVYLEEDVQNYFVNIAESKGKDYNNLINSVLKKDIELYKEFATEK